MTIDIKAIRARCEVAEEVGAMLHHTVVRACLNEIERLQKVVEASKQCCALSPDECDMGSEHCMDCESWDYSHAVKKLLEH